MTDGQMKCDNAITAHRRLKNTLVFSCSLIGLPIPRKRTASCRHGIGLHCVIDSQMKSGDAVAAHRGLKSVLVLSRSLIGLSIPSKRFAGLGYGIGQDKITHSKVQCHNTVATHIRHQSVDVNACFRELHPMPQVRLVMAGKRLLAYMV